MSVNKTAAAEPVAIDGKALAVELFNIQAQHNNGRGISCVRGLCSELEREQIAGAKAFINTDSDKMRNYPDVVAVLKRVGLWEEIDWAKFGS
ncbi:hypothetical protein BH11CYA1_BH11CYA1_07890 [soil metagenome]